MKNVFYFQHDYSARNDEKTAALIADHGLYGYGVYWAVAEMMHEEECSCIAYDDRKLARMAAFLRTTAAALKGVLEDCIHVYELFYLQDGMLCCARVLRNKEKREKVIEQKRTAGRNGGTARANKYKAGQPGEELTADALHNVTDAQQNLTDAKQHVADARQNVANKQTNKKTNKAINIDTNVSAVDEVISDWNTWAAAYGKPQVLSATKERKQKIRARIAEPAFQLQSILQRAANSTLIRDGTWFTFDWVIASQTNYAKVLEGNYDNASPPQQSHARLYDHAAERAAMEERSRQLGKEHYE